MTLNTASYPQTLTYLYNLQKHGIQPGLERMHKLLARLHDPHQRFPSIHIAGTNGKGSTAAMVASILRQAGYRVGLYTSPHLIDFTERITINGVPIPQAAVVTGTEQVRAVSETLSLTITFFEFVTALAFCYFADAGVDIAVVEVGLGGRFDATNVLSPQVTAITQIDFDHQQYLGSTLLEIAKEKAGIIKKGVPVITGATPPDVIRLIEETASSCNAPMVLLGREITVLGNNPREFVYRGRIERMVSCPLLGAHQTRNAGIALGIIEALQITNPALSISEKAILEGIRCVEWPGRLQRIKTDPLIFLDGAHNPGGAKALADFLQTIDPNHAGRHIVIVGLLKDKDIQGILNPLLSWADEFIFTQPDVERAADAAQLRAALGKPIPTTLQETVIEAIRYAESKIRPSDTLVITGSLYTVGEALAYFTGAALSSIRG